MESKEIKELRDALFNGEYSNILKPLSSGNTFLVKSTINSYISDFNGKRKLSAIELFTSGNSNLHYEDDGSVLRVVKDLIENKRIERLSDIKFDSTANGALLYGDFVRFIFALYFGNYSEELNILASKIYEEISKIARLLVGGFNSVNRISAAVASSIYRSVLDVLSDFSELAGDPSSRAEVMYYKSYITCNVMGDYRALVGPDMIKTALCFEEIEDFDKAKRIYEAVVSDFECVLSGITFRFENYDPKDKAEDYVSLVSLWQACAGINKMEGANVYREKMLAVEEAIEKIKKV